MANTQPKIRCPINSTVIKFRNATIDYSILAHLPLDGFTWIAYLKVFKPIVNVRHKKRLIFCVMIEASVIKNQQLENSLRKNTIQRKCRKDVKPENCFFQIN